ncbi:MAG: tetratricopeptide repeat protein [Planctomycetaceae bacterium]
MPLIPLLPACRRWSADSSLRAMALLAIATVVVASVASAQAPAAAKQKPAEDDPFADELNPLGGGKPRTAPGTGLTRPQTPLTRPLPDVPTLPRDPEGGVAPDADAGAARPRRDRSLPLPFPEAEGPDPAAEPSAAEPFLAQAAKFEQDKRYAEAEAVLVKAVAADPKNTAAALALGMVRRRLGDLVGAVKAYSAGLRVDEFDSALLFRRGIAWFHLGQHRIALEDFDDAGGLSFDDPYPELWRGLTYMELGRPRDAIVAYSAAIQRDRKLMAGYLNRGLAYLVAGEPDKAETDFELAIRHAPDDARAWFNRGVAQARQGEFADAASSFEAALHLQPSFTAARRNLEAVRGRPNRATGG